MGFALCGSFCTHARVLEELEKLCREYETVLPVVSEVCQRTDTRFGTAEAFLSAVEFLQFLQNPGMGAEGAAQRKSHSLFSQMGSPRSSNM